MLIKIKCEKDWKKANTHQLYSTDVIHGLNQSRTKQRHTTEWNGIVGYLIQYQFISYRCARVMLTRLFAFAECVHILFRWRESVVLMRYMELRSQSGRYGYQNRDSQKKRRTALDTRRSCRFCVRHW